MSLNTDKSEFSSDICARSMDHGCDDFFGMEQTSSPQSDGNESSQINGNEERQFPTLLEYALHEFKKKYPVRMVVFSAKHVNLYYWDGRVYVRDLQEAYAKSKCLVVLDHLIPNLSRNEGRIEPVISDLISLISEKVCKNYYCKPGYREKIAKSLLDKIKSDTELRVSFFSFDDNVCMVNTPDGIVDLNDLTLRKQTPEDYVMKCTRGRFIPEYRVGLKALLFYQTMLYPFIGEKVLYDNEASILRDYFTNISAAALLGGSKTKSVFIEKGPPDCGKTLRINAISHVINSYAGIVTPASLIRATENDTQRRPDLIALIGSRLLIVQEPDPHRPLNVAQLKAISGGDKISLRQNHDSNPVDVSIVGAVYIVCNLTIDFKTKENVEEAMLKRMRIMEWNYSVYAKDESLPESLRDPDEEDRLFTEMCFHAHEVLVNGSLPQNPYMEMSKCKVALLQSDYVSTFFQEVLVSQCPPNISPVDYQNELSRPYTASSLFEVLRQWLFYTKNISDPLPEKTVFQRMEEVLSCVYGISKTRRGNGMVYIGLYVHLFWLPAFPSQQMTYSACNVVSG